MFRTLARSLMTFALVAMALPGVAWAAETAVKTCCCPLCCH